MLCTSAMTRAQLFERYLRDALDKDALAELARRREGDPEFMDQFEADLVATGKFRKTKGGVQRIEGGKPGDRKRPKLITAIDPGTEGATPAPKLIMGTSAEMPKALQFLGVGEEPPPDFYADESSPLVGERLEEGESGSGVLSPGQAEPAHPSRSVEEIRMGSEEDLPAAATRGKDQVSEEHDAIAEMAAARSRESEGVLHAVGSAGQDDSSNDKPQVEADSPPDTPPPAPAPPPPAPASQQDHPPAAIPTRPLQAKIIPPEPDDPAYEYFQNVVESYGQQYDPGDPNVGILRGQSPPQRLRSAKQSTSRVFVGVAVLLLLSIGGALFFGMNRRAPDRSEGAGVIAKVDSLQGEAVLLRKAGSQDRLEDGYDLREGDVITVREGFLRVAYVEEKTYLHIWSGSEVTLGKHTTGKQLRVGRGVVTLDVAPQPDGQPMVVRGGNATVTLKSARATVYSRGQETRVEVVEGSAQVVRPRDGARIQISAGGWTEVNDQALPRAWNFLAGVNLNGGEVAVDGGTWFSYTKAQSEGFKVGVEGKEGSVQETISTQQPSGHVPGAGLQGMLMSKVSVNNATMSLRWPRENGLYQVFVWMMEDEGNSVRSLRLNVENKKIPEELGRKQTLGAWNRFGPYRAEVKDGSLDLLLSANSKFQSKNPHLSGIAVYGLAATGATAGPGEERGVGVLDVDSSFEGENLATEPTVPD